MPDIDFGQLSEALNDKSDRDLRNVDTTAKADAVIDFQLPTAENNYTWYRKYKSGWVEQGGSVSGGTSETVTFPIEMADTHYTVAYGNISGTYEQVRTNTKTTTSINIKNSSGGGTVSTDWQVSGLSAN